LNPDRGGRQVSLVVLTWVIGDPTRGDYFFSIVKPPRDTPMSQPRPEPAIEREISPLVMACAKNTAITDTLRIESSA